VQKDSFKDLFTFNKAERRAVFILASIIFVLILYNIFSPYFQIETSYDFASFNRAIKILQLRNDSLKRAQEDSIKRIENNSIKNHALFRFDPNTLTQKGWLKLGLSKRQAKSIRKYVRKGGRFYRKEDLHKMYCLNKEEYNKLLPYVSIKRNETEEAFIIDYDDPIATDTIIYDLNSITFYKLLNINGIGPSIAKGIIKYRKLLGGYTQVEQLKEVYHIDSTRYNNIAKYFTINTDSVHQFDLNTISYYQLKKHPYISKKLAYEITQYRQLKGEYKLVEDLRKVKDINDSIFQKIYLYFAISDKPKNL